MLWVISVLGFFLAGILALFWDFVERFGCCFVLVKMGKGGIFHVFWGFVIGYVPFCFASCMVAEIFGLVKETRDFFVLCRWRCKKEGFLGFYFESLQWGCMGFRGRYRKEDTFFTLLFCRGYYYICDVSC